VDCTRAESSLVGALVPLAFPDILDRCVKFGVEKLVCYWRSRSAGNLSVYYVDGAESRRFI
jgi:hypothetical protein